jgi:hypothetical protein
MLLVTWLKMLVSAKVEKHVVPWWWNSYLKGGPRSLQAFTGPIAQPSDMDGDLLQDDDHKSVISD